MTRTINRTMGSLEWCLLIILSIIWGGAFFFAKVAVDELPPLTLVFCRVAPAALTLLVLVYLSGNTMPKDSKTLGRFMIMGLLNNLIPFSLIFWGQVHIASGLASILNATTPLFTVVFAHMLTRDEKLSGNRLTGVFLGLIGVVIMIGPAALHGLKFNLFAQFAILGAACSYAFAGIFGRGFKDLPPLVTAAGQVSATSIMMLPIILIVDKPWQLPIPSATTWLAVAFLALVCTALAYLIYFRLLASAGATNLLLVTFLIPVSAILLGTVFLGERLLLNQFGGMLLISFGLLAIDGRLLKVIHRQR